ALGRADATNLDEVINNFVAPTTGTYYVRVAGAGQMDAGKDYNLVVTRNADFDTEPHDRFISTPAQYLVPVGGQAAARREVGHTDSKKLTFDELPFQPVDGLSYKGVTFGFTVNGQPSTDANYHSFGPGKLTYVQDPSLEGNTLGTLTLTFAKPTTVLQFGL